MAKNTATSASATARKAAERAAEHSISYAEKKEKRKAEIAKEFGGLVYHTATISGGKKFPEGTKVDAVLWVGPNKYLAETASIVIGDEKHWINPKYLTKGKPLPAATKARYEAEREAESEVTVLIPATCIQVSKNEEKPSYLLSSPLFARNSWVPATHAEKVGYVEASKLDLWEIPAWKVRKDQGVAALNYVQSQQKSLEAGRGKTAPAAA